MNEQNEQITGALFKQMVLHGAAAINAQKQAINDLNEGFEDIPGGFIEMETSLPVGDRVENTLYGLILVDFSS